MDTPVADPYRMKVLLAGGIGGARYPYNPRLQTYTSVSCI